MPILTPANSTVRRATPADLPGVLSLARRETETIGFLTRQALREYVGRGGLLVVHDVAGWMTGSGGRVVGFAVWRLSHGRRQIHAALPTGRHAKLIQVCVHPAFRGRGVGRSLVSAVVRAARRRRCEFVSLWCADDLRSNGFYDHLGFRRRGSREGGARRSRVHNLWVMSL